MATPGGSSGTGTSAGGRPSFSSGSTALTGGESSSSSGTGTGAPSAPPFTPEQLEWLDTHWPHSRTMIPAGAGHSSSSASSGTPASSSGPGVPSFMPTFTTTTAGSSSGASALPMPPPPPPPPSTLPGTTPLNPSIPGVSLIPPKLVTKILQGEYIEMRELLPESWRSEEGSSTCCRMARPKRGGLITDFSLWTECFSLLAAVITSKYPDKAPHLMAYLRTITRASRNYEDLAWASYDAAFRCQAANRSTFDWSQVDTTLFNEAFTGRARLLPRCPYCLSDTHRGGECQYGPHEDAPQSKVPRMSSTPVGGRQFPTDKGQAAVQICGKFNQATGNQCSFRWCRYAHICLKCRKGPHPASECPGNYRPPTNKQTVPQVFHPK